MTIKQLPISSDFFGKSLFLNVYLPAVNWDSCSNSPLLLLRVYQKYQQICRSLADAFNITITNTLDIEQALATLRDLFADNTRAQYCESCKLVFYINQPTNQSRHPCSFCQHSTQNLMSALPQRDSIFLDNEEPEDHRE